MTQDEAREVIKKMHWRPDGQMLNGSQGYMGRLSEGGMRYAAALWVHEGVPTGHIVYGRDGDMAPAGDLSLEGPNEYLALEMIKAQALKPFTEEELRITNELVSEIIAEEKVQ